MRHLRRHWWEWLLLAFVCVVAVGVLYTRSSERRQVSEFDRDAKVALQALQDLRAVVRGGTLYADYVRRVGDTGIVTERFLSKWNAGLSPTEQKIRRHIEHSIFWFREGTSEWESMISLGLTPSSLDSWEKAGDHIMAAELLLNPPRTISPGGRRTFAKGANITLLASEFRFEPEAIEVPHGQVRFTVTNTGVLEHSFSIEGTGIRVGAIPPGGTRTITGEIQPGVYRIVCAIPGHTEAGQVAVIIVRP